MIHGKGRVPYLSRELQRKNNNGENSHLNFSLYPREICNTTVNLFREVLACTIKRITALTVNKNNLIFRASYERAYFRGKLASASLKQFKSGLRVHERRYFRGKLASASLKQLRQAISGRPHQNFRGKLASASLKPGEERPGKLKISTISEANLPRPH